MILSSCAGGHEGIYLKTVFLMAFSRNSCCVCVCVGDDEDLPGGHWVSGTLARKPENVCKLRCIHDRILLGPSEALLIMFMLLEDVQMHHIPLNSATQRININ